MDAHGVSGGQAPGTSERRGRARRALVLLATVLGLGVFAMVAEAVTPPAYAATASLTPALYYIGDSTGSVYQFTVKNTGTTASIGAVEINRPTTGWTITSCPTPPAGWTAQTADPKCRFRSGASTTDDIKPGQSRTFYVRAKTAAGNTNRIGTWSVVVSKSNQFDNPSILKSASPAGAGLTTTLYTFELTTAVVSDTAVTPGIACPAENKDAIIGSTKTIVVCGKNRANIALTPTSAFSSLGGSFVATPGTFLSGPIVANSGNVALAQWTGTTISGTYGTDKHVIAQVGSAANRTSPLRTFTGYSATSQPPNAVNDAYSTNEDTPLVVTAPGVLANDSDPEGDPITAGHASTPGHGSVTLNSNGSFTYTPNANYNGPDSFTYTANDTHSDSAPATVSITVTAVNDAPTAADVSDSTDEDTLKTVTLNAADVDGDSLTYSVVTGPSNGSLGSVTGNTVDYTPNANFHGTDTFTYKASDGTADSNTATVTITVNSVNDVPVANDDSASTSEDTPLVVSAPGVLANDTDADADGLTATVVDGPDHAASFTLNPNGSYSYTPVADYNGPDSFTYKANDGTADSNTATVTLTVTAVNDAPTAADVSDSTDEDTLKTVTLNAADVDNATLTYSIVTGPSNGSLGSVTGNTVDYTPGANFHGTDTFTYKATDGTADSNTATVTITVNSVNDLPVATDDGPYQTVEATLLHVAAPGVLGNDTDADTPTDTLTAVNASDPANGSVTLNTDGSFDYTPDAGYTGPDSFTYDASDGTATDSGTVSITVVPPNAAPTVEDVTASGNEDAASITVTLKGNDADDDDLTFSVVTQPDNGADVAVSGTPDCTTTAKVCTLDVTYTPDANFFGTDTFTYKANDGTVDSNVGTATITVNAVNDAPTDIALSNSSVAENQASGTAVGTLSTTDVDSSDTHTYTLVSGTGSTDNASFTIAGNTLQTAASFDYETKSSYSVRVRSTDSGTGALFVEKQFTIGVTNVNDAPTNIALSPSSIPENSPAASTVGTLTTTDQDAGDTFAYSLVSGTGDDNNASFTIVGDTVRTAGAFDFETKNSYTIRVRSTDQGSLFTEKALTVTVTNVNETPTDIALSSQAIDENLPASTTIGTASTTDPDAGDTFTYSLVGGTGSTDNASFSFSGNALKSAVSFNFEVKSSYSIRVRTTDAGGLFYDEVFTITVNDVNDPPIALDDVYNNANGDTDAIGNTKFTLNVAGQTGPVKNATASGPLTNDTDEDQLPAPDTLSITFGDPVHGTILTGNTDGSFVYLPDPAFVGNDTVSYTLSDGQGGTDTGQITIQVDNMVWYVDDSAASAGTGQSTTPYQSLSSLGGADLDVSGDTIFVYSGTYTAGIPLESSQQLLGEPNGLLMDSVQLVAAGGTNPTIGAATGNAITLANDVNVQRVSTGGSIAGKAVAGTSITNATIGANTTLAGGTTGGVSLTGAATGTISIASTITNTAGNSIVVSNRSGGTVTFSGTVTDSGAGVSLSSNTGGALNLQGNVTVTGAGGLALSSNSGGTTTLSGNLTTSNGGINATSNAGHTMDLSGVLHLTGTGTTEAFNATGGGTVKATAADNTASTVTGRAVDIESTTIGTGGVTFKSVSAGNASSGPDSGIVLDSTGSTAGLTVSGGTSPATNSGGIIQKTTSHAVSLTNTDLVSLNWMSVLNSSRAGIKGAGVTGFTLTHTTLNGTGTAHTSVDDGAIAFNDTAGGTNNNLDGTVVITNNAVSNVYGSGIDIFNYNGTIANATIDTNTLDSSSNPSLATGTAIRINLFGSASTVASMTKGSISNNVVTNFPGGAGIKFQGANTTSVSAPAGTYGSSTTPGTGTSMIAIVGNSVTGNATNKINGDGISASVTGRGSGSFDIRNNNPITNVQASGIAIGGAGNVNVQFNVTGNTIDAQNTLNNAGIGFGIDKNIQADALTADGAVIKAVISSNTVSGEQGHGIYQLLRDSTASVELKMQNNNVSAPSSPGFVSIRVDVGSSGNAAFNPTLCSTISGNTAATGPDDGGGNQPSGIVIVKRQQTNGSIFKFGITGLAGTTAANAESKLSTDNPASGTGVGFYGGKKVTSLFATSVYNSCTLSF